MRLFLFLRYPIVMFVCGVAILGIAFITPRELPFVINNATQLLDRQWSLICGKS